MLIIQQKNLRVEVKVVRIKKLLFESLSKLKKMVESGLNMKWLEFLALNVINLQS